MKQITLYLNGIKILNRSPRAVIKVIKVQEQNDNWKYFVTRTLKEGYSHDDGKGTIVIYPTHNIIGMEVSDAKDKAEE